MRGQGAQQTHKLLHEGSLVSFFKGALEKRVAGTQPSRDGSHKLCPDHCSGLGNNEHYVLPGSSAWDRAQRKSPRPRGKESLFLSNHQETIETSSQILPNY